MREQIMKLEIEGTEYKVIKKARNRRTQKIMFVVYNDKREQYEVYIKGQNPFLVPAGTDDYDPNIALCDACRRK